MAPRHARVLDTQRGQGASVVTAGDGATLVKDEDSYAAAYREALQDCKAAWRAASKPRKGAEARVLKAAQSLRDLKTFVDEVARHVGQGSIGSLTTLRESDAGPWQDMLRQLVVGEWRGIFLLNPAGPDVVGLVFSRHPHELGARVKEIAARYAPIDTPEAVDRS
jgi:hypothetical protein